jgi:hypothetical protein
LKPFDERLFSLKLREAADWMQTETMTRRKQIDYDQRKLGQAFGSGWLAKRVDGNIGVLREYLPKVDKVCRETWLSDNDEINPDFIRRILVPHIVSQIAVRKSTIQGEIRRVAEARNRDRRSW